MSQGCLAYMFEVFNKCMNMCVYVQMKIALQLDYSPRKIYCRTKWCFKKSYENKSLINIITAAEDLVVWDKEYFQDSELPKQDPGN